MANPKPHAIVFPCPYQGHITPTINLSLKLATNGFIITFVHAEFIHHSTSKAHNLNSDADIFVEAQKLGLDIRYTTISNGFSVDFDRHMINYHQYWDTMFRQFPPRVEDLVVKIIGDEEPTSFFLVTDTFYSWIATPICKKYGLIDVSLWTEPALVFSINYNLDLLTSHAHFPSSETKFLCVVDMRERMNPPLPSGYYGNALAFPAAIMTAETLSENPLDYAVELVREAKQKAEDEYVRSVADLMVVRDRLSFTAARTYMVSNLRHLRYEEVDFGWGKAAYGGVAEGFDFTPTPVSWYRGLKNEMGQEEEGIVVAECLPLDAMEEFAKQIQMMMTTAHTNSKFN